MMSLSATQFYPSTPDTSRHQRLAAAAEKAASLDGPEYRESVTGPSILRRDFARQDQAIQFASRDSDFSVFAYEVGRMGQRRFLVCAKETFWIFYRTLSVRNYYEVIPDGQPCKLYFDLEFSKNMNTNKDGYLMTKKLVEITIARLEEERNVKSRAEDVMILESSTDNKFSVHLIFCRTVFINNEACGAFVREMMSSLTESDKDILTVSDKDGESTTLLVDQAVYTRNRNFRLFLSSKFGKAAALHISPLDQHNSSLADKMIFYNSLLTNVEPGTKNLGWPCENTVTYTNTIDKDHHRYTATNYKSSSSSSSLSSSSSSLSSSSSPFTEIDQFVSRLVMPGYIRRWQYNQSSNTIHYDILGNRWCQNIGRQHKSNNVYWVCNISRGVVVQGCHDPDCWGFRGDEIPLPQSAMPWNLMKEWDDDDDVTDDFFDDDEESLLNASRDY